MLLIAEMNHFGHLEVDVASKRLRKRINRELNRQRPNESILYIQQDMEVKNFIENYIPKRYRKDLDNGYMVRFRFSDHDFGWMIGLD